MRTYFMDLAFLWKYLHKFCDVTLSVGSRSMGHTHRSCTSKMDFYYSFLVCFYAFLFLCINIPVDCYVHHRNRRQNGVALDDLFWNKSNEIFHADNNWHVKNVNLGDQIAIVCPYRQLSNFEENNDAYYSIFVASKSNYDNCARIADHETKEIFKCNNPNSQKKINIQFIKFSPFGNNGLEFEAGRSYYIYTMSTGSKEGILNENSAESACSNWHMKLTFNVHGPNTQTQPPPPLTDPPSITHSTTPSKTVPSTTKMVTKPSSTPNIVKTVPTKKTYPGDNSSENETGSKTDPNKQTSGSAKLTNHRLPVILCTVLHIFLVLLLRT